MSFPQSSWPRPGVTRCLLWSLRWFDEVLRRLDFDGLGQRFVQCVRRIWPSRWWRSLRVEVGPYGGITHRVAPIDERFLLRLVEWIQARADSSQLLGTVGRHRQRLRGAISLYWRHDSPIGAGALLGRVEVDQNPLSHPAGLVRRNVQGPERLSEPIFSLRGFVVKRRAGVAHEKRRRAPPYGFEPEIVVHTAVGQQQALPIVALIVEVGTGCLLEGFGIDAQRGRRQEGRKRTGGGHSDGDLEASRLDQPDAIVSAVWLREAKVDAGREIRRIENEARWIIRKILKRRRAIEMLSIGLRQNVGDRLARYKDPFQDRGRIDGLFAEFPQRTDDFVNESLLGPARLLELRPLEAEQTGGDRTTRDARHAGQRS